MKVIRVNCEFASELVCVIPYVNWLHQNGQLEKVITSKGMKPFYYFCDNVEEKFESRTFDVKTNGLDSVPNPWIHHNSKFILGKELSELSEVEQANVNGVLDYTKWTPPLYKEYFRTEKFNELKPYIVINNNFNVEYGNDISKSRRYFNIKILNEIFNYLTEKNYNIIYKRPNNTEFAPDQNEMITLSQNITLRENTDVGIIDDYQLCEYYDNVYNINDLVEEDNKSYNEFQLELFSSASGFITTNGGGGILCGYFNVPVVMHIPHGKELRTNYLTNEDSYYNKLSDNNLYVVIDPNNQSNYTKVMNKIKEVYRGESK